MHENRTIKPVEIVLRRAKGKDKGGKFDQGILYACVEITQ
jgi:hypothetical protein